jgi:polyisoprenyl-phosphate glycosyltransferase
MKRDKTHLSDTIISLILVTENDEDIVGTRLEEINKTLSFLDLNYEILIVDNNSSDNTVKKITKLKKVMHFSRILVLSKTYERAVAITAGIDACVGDYAIVFDIYTDPVEMITYFLTSKLIKGKDIIIGKVTGNLKEYSLLSKIFLDFVEKFSKHGISYRQHYLMGLSRKAINSIMRTRRKSRNFGYINNLIGLTKETIEYEPLKKYKRKIKKVTFFEVLTSIIDISLSNSLRPIRFLSLCGMTFSLLYILYVVIIVILVVVFGMKSLAPQGWITLSTVLGTAFFLLFSILAVISEYVIRILNETRNEPLYFVSEEIGKSNILPKDGTLNIV